MSHPRILIRDAIKARLDQNLFSVDPRFTPNRIHLMKMTPLFAGKLPAVLIYSKQESIDDMPGEHQGNRYRKLTMAVEVVTSGESAANEADVIAWAIEQQLEADETLAHLVEAIRLTNTDVEFDSEGDTPVMAVRLNFEVRYWTRQESDDALIPQQVLTSWSPNIGTPNEPKYKPLGDDDGWY